MTDIVNPGAPSVTLNSEAMPANVDLVLYRGDYIEIFVDVADDEGTPVPLEGMTPSAQLRETYESIDSVDFSCSVVDGRVRIYMPSATSATLTEDTYIWDFQLTNVDSDSRTYFTGDVTVSPEVTKP